MNKKLVASALMGLILSAGLLAAQSEPATDKSSPEAARLTRVSVHRGKEGVSVEITCSRPVTPTPTMISDPTRLVLDFADTILAEPRSRISVDHDGLKAVRLGVQPVDPPTTRVVLDLDQQRAYQLVSDGSKLTVKLGDRSIAVAGDPAAQSPEANSVSPSPAAGQTSLVTPAAAATPSPAGADSAVPTVEPPSTQPDADPAATSKSAGQAVESQPQTPPVQIASADPNSAAAASAASVENAEDATKRPVEPKPLTQVSDQRAASQLADASPASDKPLAPAPAAASPAATAAPNAGAKSSPATLPPPPPVSSASTQPLSLSAAKITPDLPVVAPPATPALQTTPSDYVIGEQDVLSIVVWKERELSGQVVVRPDGKITLPLVNEIKVVGMTPAQLQELLTEKFKPFLNIPQVTVEVVQINSRKAYLIGEVNKTGTFPLNSSTTVLQIIAEAGGLRDFAKRKDIYILRNQKGHQVRYRFNYDEVIRGKNTQQNIVLQPGDMVVVP